MPSSSRSTSSSGVEQAALDLVRDAVDGDVHLAPCEVGEDSSDEHGQDLRPVPGRGERVVVRRDVLQGRLTCRLGVGRACLGRRKADAVGACAGRCEPDRPVGGARARHGERRVVVGVRPVEAGESAGRCLVVGDRERESVVDASSGSPRAARPRCRPRPQSARSRRARGTAPGDRRAAPRSLRRRRGSRRWSPRRGSRGRRCSSRTARCGAGRPRGRRSVSSRRSSRATRPSRSPPGRRP